MLEIITKRPNRKEEHLFNVYEAITITSEDNGNYYYRYVDGFIMELTCNQDINLYKQNDMKTWEDFIEEEIELYDGDNVEYYFNPGIIKIEMED